MFYDCLIWSILTLLIYTTNEMHTCAVCTLCISHTILHASNEHGDKSSSKKRANIQCTTIEHVCLFHCNLQDYRKRSFRPNAISQGKWFCMSGIDSFDGRCVSYALTKWKLDWKTSLYATFPSPSSFFIFSVHVFNWKSVFKSRQKTWKANI